jgi:hypothetical protein
MKLKLGRKVKSDPAKMIPAAFFASMVNVSVVVAKEPATQRGENGRDGDSKSS